MLTIKFYKNFKGGEDFILILGSVDDYKEASSFFRLMEGCSLSSVERLRVMDLGPIDPYALVLAKEECQTFSEICDILAKSSGPAHEYFSARNCPDVDFLLSCGEYTVLP